MYTKTILAALLTVAIAAPVANTPTKSSDVMNSIESIVGSPFGNGNYDGSGNSAGNGNEGNGNSNGNGNGNKNGNGNIFGNGNNIGSGNSGTKIGRKDASSGSAKSLGDWISGVTGSPFGNGNGNGAGNSAGNGNKNNGNGNGNENGNGNGKGNTFGNGNNIGSGNSGFTLGRKVRRAQALGIYVGTIIDDVTVPLNPGSPNTIVASPSNNGIGSGSGNTAGSNNANNGNNSGNHNGANNGNGNSFGNNNNILSGDCGVCSGPIIIDPSLTIG